jgi:hypothetical protein
MERYASSIVSVPVNTISSAPINIAAETCSQPTATTANTPKRMATATGAFCVRRVSRGGMSNSIKSRSWRSRLILSTDPCSSIESPRSIETSLSLSNKVLPWWRMASTARPKRDRKSISCKVLQRRLDVGASTTSANSKAERSGSGSQGWMGRSGTGVSPSVSAASKMALAVASRCSSSPGWRRCSVVAETVSPSWQQRWT